MQTQTLIIKIMHAILKQFQEIRGQSAKFKVQATTYWKWNFLYTSLVQQAEDMNLIRQS